MGCGGVHFWLVMWLENALALVIDLKQPYIMCFTKPFSPKR